MTALRLTKLARDHGLHDGLHERLMDAYWREPVDLGVPDELRRLAHDLPPDEVEPVLDGHYRDRVLASTRQALSIGINDVPCFVVDGRLLILGAQPRDVFERAFTQLGRG